MSNSADGLEPGDFLYQSDQELFLCVIENGENSITFAAHGWRDIDKERIDEYIDDSRSKVHTQESFEEIVEEQGDESTKNQFNKLKQLFAVYRNADIPSDGPHDEFAFEEK
jgi:hypothetical protein